MPGTFASLHRLLQRALLVMLSLLGGLWPGAAQAQPLQPIPALTARVVDLSATLSPLEARQIQARLQTLEDETGAQIVVLMLGSTAPEDIAAYAHRVASDWKIGRKSVGDGLLIVVAKDDRRMRIEVAKRLEGAVPDLMAARIIDQAMKPRLKDGDYAGGLLAAIDRLSLLIHGEQLPAPEAGGPPGSGWLLIPFSFFGFAIGVPLSRSLFGKGLGSLLMAAGMGGMGYWLSGSAPIALATGLVAMLFVWLGNSSRNQAGRQAGSRKPNSRRKRGHSRGDSGWHGGGGGWSSGSSDSWSSSSSDSFSSGGGGDFGGGGASGDW
ncbi:TPM domain-containing protein [Comamonas composti]|uniref:TPM domain-containing protein n=1 Tax=Comamonas composti TaxID=408558 RepID=UPI00041B6F53|nr:TPM domain-containing protein [Comamonas composti]